MRAVKTIGIVLFDGVEELDAVGPWEVLAAWTQTWPEDGWQVTTVALGDRTVRAAKGMTFVADTAAEGCGPLDLIVMPGGQGTRPLLADEAVLTQVRAWADRAEITTSVCTGALVHAAAGLLAGRPATTHWASLDLLAQLEPTVEVRPDDRFVDDGDVITAAGVSAGIDMALHLVARLAGAERARTVRRYIQYDPAPPV